MIPRDTFTIAIVGAGLSGLCLAQYLKRNGIDVHVYERDRAPQTRGQGYRITLDRHGYRALQACLPSPLFMLFQATSGAPGGFFRFMRSDLREIFRLSFPSQPGADDRHPGSQADRSTLRQILLSGLEDRVFFGKGCQAIEAQPTTATAHFTDGSSVNATVVVGADGAGSYVRQSLLPRASPFDLGSSAIYGKSILGSASRSIVPAGMEKSGVLSIGSPGKAFFFTTMAFKELPQNAFPRFTSNVQPLGQSDYIMWGIVFPDRLLSNPNASRDPDALLAFAREQALEFHPALRRILEAAAPEETLLVPLRASPRVKGWSSPSLTLMGDAIHLMPPFGAHGGNTALRDAALLGGFLKQAAQGIVSVGDALAGYQKQMLSYSSREVRSSLRMMRMTSNPFGRVLLLKVLPALHPLLQRSNQPANQ